MPPFLLPRNIYMAIMTIYVSSKREHVQMWRYYRRLGHPIISSWLDLDGVLDDETIGHTHWPVWLVEACAADYLIFYATPADRNHNSCLLEIGACLAGGGRILHVGVSDTMKTLDGELADFTAHPKWTRLVDLETAFGIAAASPVSP
jgi:hypothetical protein